jgi:hypothetical protein
MSKLKNIFKGSFASTAGGLTAISGALLLGLLFGVPGFILVTRENSKPKYRRNQALLILGFILMAIGVFLGLGLNAGGLFEGIANSLSN